MPASSFSASSSSFSLVARAVSRAHGATVVLDSVDVSVGPRSRIGVVGPNGAGKTTLLRLLAGLDVPDGGSVEKRPATCTVGYLPQEPDRRADETVHDFLARRTGVAPAVAAMERTAHALGTGSPGAEEAYDVALERYVALGAADFDARVLAVCDDVGLSQSVVEQPTATLSGGQAARVSLAAILLSRFDVFLLDEPTNDLDFDGLARLEDFVQGIPGGVVVVSHDRAFLERTITSVLELDEASRRATEFRGGWLAYLEARDTARRHAEEAFAAFDQQRQQLLERARVQRQWAVSGARREKKQSDGDKMARDWRINRTEKLAAKVRITEKALDRLDAVEKPWEGWDLRLDIADAPRSGDVVARLQDAVVSRGRFRLGPINAEVHWAERVAIVGPNGSGKTTLIQAMLGRLPLDQGESWVGPGVVVGELDQARSRFMGSASLLDAFLRETGLTLSEGRSVLAKFGLGDTHVTRPADTLSPGERTRAVLALFMARGVNCLVLDEPTNHLDLPAIEQLEQALSRFEGTLLLVSHDRRLLDSVHITRTIEMGDASAAR